MMNGRMHLKAGIVVSILFLTALAFLAASAYFGTDINNDYSHTKAICQGNSCQDFLITCNDDELVKMTPLTGLVTFSDDWVDRRSDDEKRLC